MRSLFAAQILLGALVFAQDAAPADTTASGDAATSAEDTAADDAEQTFSDGCLAWILGFRDSIDDSLTYFNATDDTLYEDAT